MNEDELKSRIIAIVLRYLQDVLEPLDEQFGMEIVGKYNGWGGGAEPALYMELNDLETRADGYYALAVFTDNGDLEKRIKRLGAVLTTLAISEYADVKGGKNRPLGYFLIGNDDARNIGLNFPLFVPLSRL